MRPYVKRWENPMSRFVDYVMINMFEPALAWVLNHPIVSTLAVALLIYVSVRNYRML
jgi:hypothetical protein